MTSKSVAAPTQFPTVVETLPPHWHKARLKNWANINAEVLPETTDPNYRFNYIEIGSISNGSLTDEPKHIAFRDAPSRARRVVCQGDTIVSTVRTYLKAVWFAETAADLVCSTGFAVLSPKPNTAPKFAAYLALSDPFIQAVVADSVGIGYPAIPETKFGDIEVPVPPLEEQATIVRYLDHANELINRYISAKERLIALLEEQRQAVIHQAVISGLDPGITTKPSGIPWLGDVPEHWDVRRIKHLYVESDERSLSGIEELMSVSHITGITPRKQSVTMFLAESNQGYKLCRPGDVVVNTMWAYMAALGIARQVGLVSPSYGVYRPKNANMLDPEYVNLLLRTEDYRDEYNRRSTGITASRLRLYPDAFLDLPLLYPPPDEQTAIVRHLSLATASIGSAIKRAHRQIALINEYRTRLIADVVTGRIDVRDAVVELPD